MGEAFWKILRDLAATIAAAETTGTKIGVAIAIDVVELIVIARFIRELGFYESYVLEVFEEELLKVGEEAAQYYAEDDDQRQARALALARENPDTVYVFGGVSVYDSLLLAASGFETFHLGIPQAVFEVIQGSEVLEGAEVIALL